MFAKKFLSIVSALFIGSSCIGLTRAANIATCGGETTCGGGVTGICLHNDDKIYKSGSGCYVESSPLTSAISQATTFVFYDNAKVENLGEGGDPDSITDISKLRIVKCTFSGSASCADAYGYVLIGNKYFNVSEKQLINCTTKEVTANEETNCTGATNYCLLDGKIYGYSTSGAATCVLTPDVYVFEDDGTNATKVSIGSAAISNKDNVMLYQCSMGSTNTLSCSRTYGYVHDSQATGGAKYYAVAADGSVTDVTGNIASNQCNTAENTGGLHDTNKLCLFGSGTSPKVSGAITAAAGETYIMNNMEGNVFTKGLGTVDESSDQSIVIQATANIFSLDSDDYDYCIGTGNVLKPTFEEFCDNLEESCTPKAECTSSICKRGTGNDGEAGCTISVGDNNSTGCVENGYYLTNDADSGTLVTSGTDKFLFQCKNTNGVDCDPVPEVGFKIGYYKYAQQSDKYIKCTGYGHCTVVDVISNKANCQASGINVGDVINDDVKDILCLDTAAGYSGIPLNANANYFTKGKSGSIFNNDEETKYVKVEVAQGATSSYSVVLSSRLGEDSVIYTYTDNKLKSYVRASGAYEPSDICAASTTIIEFKHIKGDRASTTEYYIKNVEHEWPSSRHD